MSHTAVVIVAPRAPLETRQFPTPEPQGNQVKLKNEWTTTQPLDLHQADGGLLISGPATVMGNGVVGEVLALGDNVKSLKVGDKVFGYAWSSQEEKGHQTYAIISENLLAKIPSNITPEEAATIPGNFITVFHTVTDSLSLPLPWPKSSSYTPPAATTPILIWGGASSVGQYALQILTYYGYTNIIAIASSKHHQTLLSLGATKVYDYTAPYIVDSLRQEGPIPYIFDCIGSATSSIAPISAIAGSGAKVAILLPVIITPSSTTTIPEYSFEVKKAAVWKEGVEVIGVRTHAYRENKFLEKYLQPEIMPRLLEMGIVRPNRYRVVEGNDMLERAQNALDILREGVSGEKLVWRVSD